MNSSNNQPSIGRSKISQKYLLSNSASKKSSYDHVNRLKLVESRTSLVEPYDPFLGQNSLTANCDVSMSSIMNRYTYRNKHNSNLNNNNGSKNNKTHQLKVVDSDLIEPNSSSQITLVSSNKSQITVYMDAKYSDRNGKISTTRRRRNSETNVELLNTSFDERRAADDIDNDSSENMISRSRFSVNSSASNFSLKSESNRNQNSNDSVGKNSEIYKQFLVKCLRNNGLSKRLGKNAKQLTNELSNLLVTLKNYSINENDVLKCGSCCVQKIDLNESLSFFKLNDHASDETKPQLPCLYRENLNKVINEIENFNPFSKKKCQANLNDLKGKSNSNSRKKY
jgi:hypothetical protein